MTTSHKEKRNWRKHEKAFYVPGKKPEFVDVPNFSFFTIEGAGDPNKPEFEHYVKALYTASYGVRMSPKSGLAPKDYHEYTVYPLEGVWDISEEAKSRGIDEFDKADLTFTLMIRQPDFVSPDFAREMLYRLTAKKPEVQRLNQVKFERIAEGHCIQMLHIGPYDDEPASFAIMETFAQQMDYRRADQTHREIYLSDPRRSAPEKLKTVLRFRVERMD
jgi:hypothetical protein